MPIDEIEERLVRAAEQVIASKVRRRGLSRFEIAVLIVSMLLNAVCVLASMHYARQVRLEREAVRQLIKQQYPDLPD